jgi:K+-sensing histidine kinase KdpD
MENSKLPSDKSNIEMQKSELIAGYGLPKRLSTLIEISLQIDAVENRDELYEVLRNETKWLIDFDVFFICLLNANHSYYHIITLSPIADAIGLNHTYFNVDEGMPGWIIRNQTPKFCNIDNCPNSSFALEGKFDEVGTQSFLAVPIKSGQNKVGVMVFGSNNLDNFSEDDLVIAQLYGLQIAVALKNVGFFEDAKKRINQIEIINEISGTLNSTLELEDLLQSTASAIYNSFGYFDVSIFLFSGDELALKAHAGTIKDFLPEGYSQKAEEGLIGWVAMNGNYALVNDVSQDPRYLIHKYQNTRSELTIPIKISDEVVGVLNIEDTKLYAFDDTDVIVLQTLADQIASALNNAQLYEKVRNANAKLTELDNLKSEFLGIVSHDFRSPLSSIILAGKSLLKSEEVEKSTRFKEYMQLIVDQANRLIQLAEDTLSITRIESGQIHLQLKIVNIERLIKEAMSLVKLSKRHNIGFSVDPNASFIIGDQAKLRQVIQNLLSNSVKYSPHGGQIFVEVRDISDDEIQFSITDEGIGVKPDDVDKLFQKFSRVESGDAQKIKGSGLGLWICREIIEAHKGKIWIESEYGKGSIFKFTLKKAED